VSHISLVYHFYLFLQFFQPFNTKQEQNGFHRGEEKKGTWGKLFFALSKRTRLIELFVSDRAFSCSLLAFVSVCLQHITKVLDVFVFSKLEFR
jgi:hypothetical protein